MFSEHWYGILPASSCPGRSATWARSATGYATVASAGLHRLPASNPANARGRDIRRRERERERREEEGERESKLYLPQTDVQRRHAHRPAAARAQSCTRGGTRAELRPPAWLCLRAQGSARSQGCTLISRSYRELAHAHMSAS